MAFQVTLIRQCPLTPALPGPAVPLLTLLWAGHGDFTLSLGFHLQKPKALVTHGREHRAIFLLGQHTGLHQTPVSELAQGVSPGY